MKAVTVVAGVLTQQTVGGGSATFTQVELDFGSIPVYSLSFTVTDSNISPSSLIIIAQCGDAPTGKTSDDNEMDAVIPSATAGSGQMTVYCTATPGPVSGKFKFNYLLG